MQDRRRGLGLAGEAFAGRGADGEMRREDFDRHEPVQFRLIPLEHDAHAALADDFEDLDVAEPTDRLGGRGRLEALDREVSCGVAVDGVIRCRSAEETGMSAPTRSSATFSAVPTRDQAAG